MRSPFMVHSGKNRGKKKYSEREREEEKKMEREKGGMFVVGNPLKRGNTSVRTHIHTYIYTHTGAKT